MTIKLMWEENGEGIIIITVILSTGDGGMVTREK